MFYLSKNKLWAIALYCCVNTVVYLRGDINQSQLCLLVLAVALLPIMAPSLVAWFASWGFMESLAKDSKVGLSPSLVSLFYWIVLIIVSLLFLFNISIF